ncbi:hypothetical protein Tco_1455823 [Tanacetum coccineum]
MCYHTYHVFKNFTPENSQTPRLQTEDDLTGDDLKHYEAEIEAMNLILISIPKDIYNSMDACTTAQAIWQRVERLMRGTVKTKLTGKHTLLMNDLERNGIKFPKVTVNTKFLNCLQPEWVKYVTQVRLAKRLTDYSYDDLFDYLSQYEKVVNASRAKKLEQSHDPLALVAHTGSSSRIPSPYYVTHPSSVVDYDDNYQGDAFQNNSEDPHISAMINQAIMQADKVNIQSRNSGNDGRNTRHSFIPEEIIEVRKDEAGVTLLDKQNDFLVAGATRMEEIKELSINICLMARIQPANIDSDARPSYDFAFLSEVQKPSTSYVNPLFAKDNHEQNVEYDNNVQASYELKKLARNAFKEAEKQQINANKVKQQNKIVTQQLELYKEKMSENEDKYHDTVLDLEVRAKENENVVLKISRSLQGMFMLRSKPMSFYDPNVKHGLGDTKDILDDATKSQKKMDKKFMDPIAIEKKQNVRIIDYKKLNALYEDFVPQKELSAKPKYFSSTFISSENSSNANTSTSPSETKPYVASTPSSNPMKLYLEQMENEFKKLFALLQTNSKRESIFYTTLEEIRLTKFCQQKVKTILHDLHLNFEIFQK